MLKVLRRLLLLMSKVPTVIKLIPSKVLKNVLVIKTLSAVLTSAAKVRDGRAGRAVQEILPTVVSVSICKVERVVKLLRRKLPPIVTTEEDIRVVSSPAFSTMKSPVISSGPLISMVPEAEVPTRTEPEMVEQELKAVASAAELTVAVD